MPKATDTHTTIASGLNRRALLCTAPVAIAAALPEIPLLGPLVSSAGSSCSAEFREWYELALTTPNVLATVDAWERAHPDADIDERPDAKFSGSLGALEDKIVARPVCSQADIDELAIIALYWTDEGSEFELGHDIELQSKCRDKRLRAHLIQEAATLAMQRFGMGGAHA